MLPAIPTALDLLGRQLAAAADARDIALPLRALQMRGLRKVELVVHVERIRATNDATDDKEQVESNCLRALDIIDGAIPGLGLTWDAAHDAAGLLPRCLTREAVISAVQAALEPSDLLPPRPPPNDLGENVLQFLGDGVFDAIAKFESLPVRAEIIRAPHGPFTTRPAALLAFSDRVALEALTRYVEAPLAQRLPEQVVWPRSRLQSPVSDVPNTVHGWDSSYVVKADVSRFYDGVEHASLAVTLASHLDVELTQAQAIEALLGAAMSAPRGLPQGPPCSDVLASAYLLPIDLELASLGVKYLRYADDYYFPASSIAEGRLTLQRLEALLADVGLILSTTKTQIMRQSTFRAGATSSPAVQRLKQEFIQAGLVSLESAEDMEDAQQVLDRAGVPDQRIWDLLYHQRIDLDDVVAELVEALGPEYAQTYAMYFRAIALRLRTESPPDVTAMERLAFESLALLAGSDVDLRPDDLRVVQMWFPELTPQVVRYLVGSPRRRRSRWVADYVSSHLANPSGIDWIDAWMCHAVIQMPRARRALRRDVDRLREQPNTGQLTRAEALRALAAHGDLEETAWLGTVKHSSPAITSEIYFAAMADVSRYPWLSRHLEHHKDRPREAVARALEVGHEKP